MGLDFEQVIAENLGVLHKLCRIYSRDASEYEEMFQEMLIQVWRSGSGFRGDAKLSTWLYKVCINTALGFSGRAAKLRQRFAPLDGYIFQAPVTDSEKDEKIERLYAAIRELKPVDRAIVSLYLDERSYDETAEILGITKTNVATRLMRLKRDLTEKLRT